MCNDEKYKYKNNYIKLDKIKITGTSKFDLFELNDGIKKETISSN